MTEPPSTLSSSDHAGVRFPPPLLYVAGIGLGFLFQALWPLPTWSQTVGTLLALLCLALYVVLCGWAIVLFRRFRTSLVPIVPSATLVTRGPYRVTRNPMYVGLAFLYAGIALYFRLSWGLLLLPVVLIVIDRLVIAREEQYLARRFGEAYTHYKLQVRRWL